MESGGITLFLDEYNPDLAVERGVFVMGGVAVRSGAHESRAAGDFKSLAARDPRFARKGRKWDPDQFDLFVEYLLGQQLLPVAWRIVLDADLLDGIRARAESLPEARVAAGVTPMPDRMIQPMQWVLFHGVTQTLGSASVAWILRHGRLETLDVVVHRGNFKPWQQQTLREVVARWSGPYAIDAIRRREARIPDGYLAELRALACWPAPALRVQKSGPMLAVADVYTSLQARSLAGEAEAKAAVELLRVYYRCRDDGLDATFLCKDGTDGVKRDLAEGWPTG